MTIGLPLSADPEDEYYFGRWKIFVASTDAKVKILFLLSDGRPQDHGYGRDRTEKEYATSLAANLTFVRMLQQDEGIAPLGDAKLLLDMQSIVAARQAAVAASAAAS